MSDDAHPVNATQFQAALPPAVSPRLCSNQPNGGPLDPADPSTVAQPTRAIADKSKLWDNGKTLNVAFLNGNDAWGEQVKQAVRETASEWCKYANLKFVFDQPTAHIAINLVPFGNVGFGTFNCWLGKDCLAKFQQGQPSMNLVFHPSLQSNPQVMQQEFSRVILHEFGHALGKIHEHMRPDRPITWNKQKLLALFGGPPNNWSSQMIDQQIVNFYQGGALVGTAFDIQSIMMYQFPNGVAFYSDGTPFQTPNNLVLSPMDKVLANMLYPAIGVNDPNEVPLAPGDQPAAGSIQTPGQVARYKIHVITPGIYSIETHGPTPLLVSVSSKQKDPAGQLLVVEGANESLTFRAVNADKDFFIEVRHAIPMTGTGTFSIAVRQVS
jgi:hypothetical protein